MSELWGTYNIPLVNEISWKNSSILARASVDEVYNQIISDLIDAENRLADNFIVGKNQRIIPNRWAASALLARVYLYTKDWSKAEMESSSVISNSAMFGLVSFPNNVFKTNSTETIWQLQQSNTTGTYNATNEGYRIIPYDATSRPYIYLTDTLIRSFEPGDNRRTFWIDSTIYRSAKYYYPNKYKTGPAQSMPNGPYNEYYMVLRLAEQYLIRGEARLMQNNLTEAINDLNTIRQRAGINPLPNSLTQQQVLEAIEQERRVELFAEWGHRWLDLKRWGKADAVLAHIKGGNWQSTDQLYPIPFRELQANPNLIQNPGY
ncbi:MAG: RagB/SusD family nutrient uptake outer membrane protein [Chitinophagaceae bacterium]|nr:RagB/SusD family nutrient uptake outer membrane protein [Chitinophagaceae bacterium]